MINVIIVFIIVIVQAVISALYNPFALIGTIVVY